MPEHFAWYRRGPLGGGLGSRESDGRAFLRIKSFSRYGPFGTFTDFLDSGTISTMADASTGEIAKYRRINNCRIHWGTAR